MNKKNSGSERSKKTSSSADTRADMKTAWKKDTKAATKPDEASGPSPTKSEIVILGLDLSLTATGAVRYKLPWSGDFREIEWTTVGYKLARDASEFDRLVRLKTIRDHFTALARGVDVAVVEQYAFSRGQSQAHALGELGGVVKLALNDLMDVNVLNASRVRACLGKFSGKGVKKQVHALLKPLVPAEWTEDVIDAWVVANGWAVENGYGGIVLR